MRTPLIVYTPSGSQSIGFVTVLITKRSLDLCTFCVFHHLTPFVSASFFGKSFYKHFQISPCTYTVRGATDRKLILAKRIRRASVYVGRANDTVHEF